MLIVDILNYNGEDRWMVLDGDSIFMTSIMNRGRINKEKLTPLSCSNVFKHFCKTFCNLTQSRKIWALLTPKEREEFYMFMMNIAIEFIH